MDIHEKCNSLVKKWNLEVNYYNSPPTPSLAKIPFSHRSYYSSLTDRLSIETIKLITASINEVGVIAFATCLQREFNIIEQIEVAIGYRRSDGFAEDVSIKNNLFKIGIGHIVVKNLLDCVRATIYTQATTPHSKFIFDSLDFKEFQGQHPDSCNRIYIPTN